jgi:hypothetical protein
MEWVPRGLSKDGAHYHLGKEERVEVYKFLASLISDA